MSIKIITLLSIILSFHLSLNAQIEKIFVENYYVSDKDDATNTTGGKLEEGSFTYRVFVDLVKGSKIRNIFGSDNHPLLFSSTENIYNNSEDGVSVAIDLNKGRYNDNTVALDSWLTIGQTTKSGSNVISGVPKNYDTDGSFIGGVNNDGGSEEVITGLLKNNDERAGLPLTVSDGMMAMINQPSNWSVIGMKDFITGEENTIFGSVIGKDFVGKDVLIQNSGVSGVSLDSNTILIAQITTKGQIKFSLNLEIEEANGALVKYVANGTNLSSNEVLTPILNYPLECGCRDADYLEYSNTFACDDNSKCKNKIVFGCMDSVACNFNSLANFNIETLCCYIGYCNDLDLEIVCPNLPKRSFNDDSYIEVYPNPAHDQISIKCNIPVFNNSILSIHDVFGRVVNKFSLFQIEDKYLNLHNLNPGLYYIQINDGKNKLFKKFSKI